MKKTESIALCAFFTCAAVAVASLALIIVYIFSNGLPAMAEIGVFSFLFGNTWNPSNELYGIRNMILATAAVTFFSFVIGSRVGKWSAIFLSYYCPKKLYGVFKTIVELLAGIPSVIYGFFGVMVIVPFIREYFGGPGKSMLAAIIVLSIMILPTIINLSETALRAVPSFYYEGALALGSTKNEAVFDIVAPAAKSGISSAYVLGIGRAVGETMAVMLVAGNNPGLPDSLIKPVRTMTAGIAIEMNYATGLHQQALFAIGAVLFITIIGLNFGFALYSRRLD